MSVASYVCYANIKCKSRNNQTYRFSELVEYQITIDLNEEVTGTFSISIANVNGQYSGWVSPFDRINLYINNVLIMCGYVDSVQYSYDDSDNVIVIEGRDLGLLLEDNSATPKKGSKSSKTNIKDYTKKMCKRWGLSYAITKDNIPKYKGLSIGCNESEGSVVRTMTADTDFNSWFLVDRYYLAKWNLNANASYNITYDMIEDADIKLDGSKMQSEIAVYETTKKGGYKKKTTIKNKYLTKKNIKRKVTHRKYSEGSTSKMKNVGLKRMKEGYIKSCEIKLKIRPSANMIILPNKCANVVVPKLNLNSKLFVRKVEFFKDFEKGSEMNVTLIPSNTSYNSMWVDQTIIKPR